MSESYQKGRSSGVSGTYGEKRKGSAEKTAVADGGSDLSTAAASINRKAVSNGGGKDSGGDPALRQR